MKLSSKSGRGRLREEVAYERFQLCDLTLKPYFVFGKLVAYDRWSPFTERWSQREVRPGATPRKFRWGDVRPASGNPYRISDQNM